jgi:hypothetical protein
MLLCVGELLFYPPPILFSTYNTVQWFFEKPWLRRMGGACALAMVCYEKTDFDVV